MAPDYLKSTLILSVVLIVIMPYAAYGQCEPTGAFCSIEPANIEAGDLVKMSMDICNDDPDNDLDVCVLVAMEAYGHYSFHPFWDPGRLNTQVTIPACDCIDITIAHFVWQTTLHGSGSIIAALIDCDTMQVMGDFSTCAYSW